jgi:hypothetical protein
MYLNLRRTSYSGSGTTWNDDSGNNRNATIWNAPSFTASRFNLNGVDQYFSLPSGFENFTSGLTFSVLANFGTSSIWERLLDLGNGPRSDNIWFGRYGSSNSVGFELFHGSASMGYCVATDGVLSNTWATYAITIDGSNCSIYRNGVQIHTQSYTALPNNITRTINYIGRSNWSADSYFDSGIGAVAIYDRAITSADIATLSADQYGYAPSAPTIGAASTTSATSASVSFTAPTNNNGFTITSYTATSSPGGLMGTVALAPLQLMGSAPTLTTLSRYLPQVTAAHRLLPRHLIR